MISKVTTVVLCMVAFCNALPLAEQPPSYHEDPYSPHQYKQEPPKPYQFDYGVRDDYSGANFGHSEVSNGNSVEGSYQVALPDGRIQIVKYIADHENGFQAEVTYEGEARYPEHNSAEKSNSYKQPSYRPQPSYGPQYHPSEPQPTYAEEETPVYHPKEARQYQ